MYEEIRGKFLENIEKYVENTKYVGTMEKYRMAPPRTLLDNVTFGGIPIVLERILSSLLYIQGRMPSHLGVCTFRDDVTNSELSPISYIGSDDVTCGT